jgi:protein ImuA
MTKPAALSGAFASTLPLVRNRAAVMHELRRLLPAHESSRKTLPSTLSLGLAALDDHLPEGGLSCGALHEVVAESERALPAAFGFIVALLGRISSPPPCGEGLGVGVARKCTSVDVYALPPDPPPYPPSAYPAPTSVHSGTRKRHPDRGREKIVLVLPAYGQRKYGRLSGHGLNSLGLDPGRLILVETAHRKETLWALAEALRSAAPQAVVGMIDRLDLKTSQKLQLAAGDAGLPLLLLRPAALSPSSSACGRGWGEGSAAATRWRIGTAEAARDRFGMYARPRWHLQLERCRNGRPGEWVVEYDHVAHRFSLAAALADPAFSRGASDRPFRQAAIYAKGKF